MKHAEKIGLFGRYDWLALGTLAATTLVAVGALAYWRQRYESQKVLDSLDPDLADDAIPTVAEVPAAVSAT